MKRYENEEEFDKIINTLIEQDACCDVCLHYSTCNHCTVENTPNGPIFAQCVDGDYDDWVDYESLENWYEEYKMYEETT